MPFPATERFVYDNNPLEEVICQVRFPRILRIESEAPADFQDAIRDRYPLYNEPTFSHRLEVEIPPQMVEALGNLIAAQSSGDKRSYQFASTDEQWTVTLNSGFLALSTRQYTRWEEFREHLGVAVEALWGIYKPVMLTRVGLRYKNAIHRSKITGLPDVPWDNLFEAHVMGIQADSKIGKAVQKISTQALIEIESGVVKMQYGIGTAQQSGEEVYIVDSDFYTEDKCNKEEMYNVLDTFNQNSRRLFRWCITDKLHNAMGPKPIQ